MVALAALAALVLVPVVGAVPATTTLRVDVAEWSVVPSSGVVPSGRVRLVIRNIGYRRHELVVVCTTRFAQALPLRGGRAVVHAVAPAVVVPPGATRTIVLSLARGSYLLVDNLPWHYWAGTSAAFAVR